MGDVSRCYEFVHWRIINAMRKQEKSNLVCFRHETKTAPGSGTILTSEAT